MDSRLTMSGMTVWMDTQRRLLAAIDLVLQSPSSTALSTKYGSSPTFARFYFSVSSASLKMSQYPDMNSAVQKGLSCGSEQLL
jgi:hypothetical protein